MRPFVLLTVAAALLMSSAAQAQPLSVTPASSTAAGGVRPAIGDVTDVADKPPESAGKAQNRRVEVKLSKATDDEGSDTSGKASDGTTSVEFKDSVRTAREHGSR